MIDEGYTAAGIGPWVCWMKCEAVFSSLATGLHGRCILPAACIEIDLPA
jgi:hypothetical protein